MRRRTLLATSGTALAGLAGCGSRQRPDSQTATDATRTDSLALELDALQPAVVELFVDAYELVARPNSQYLFLTGPAVDGEDRRFRFDGERYEPGVDIDYCVATPDVPGCAQNPPWLLFELPETGDASDAALLAPEGQWQPDDGLRARLSTPLASPQLTSFELDADVAAGTAPTFSLSARNDSADDAWFVGALNRLDAMTRSVAPVSYLVPAESTVSWHVLGNEVGTPTPSRNGGSSTLEYELTWLGGSETVTVPVQG